MKLSEYKRDFYAYSESLSAAVRNASLAGLGVVWIFRVGDGQDVQIPRELLVPIAAFSGALAAEFLQYLAGSLIWFTFHRYHERRINPSEDDPNLSHPPVLTLPVWLCFAIKVLAVIAGHWSLGIFLFRAWS